MLQAGFFPGSFVFILDSIAGLGCASCEKLDSIISLCSIILSEYTRGTGHSLALLRSTLMVIEALILNSIVNPFIFFNATRES